MHCCGTTWKEDCLRLLGKVLFSTSSTQAPLYLTVSINLCSHSLSSLSSSTSQVFSHLPKYEGHFQIDPQKVEHHWHNALSLTGPEACRRHQQEESMGKQRRLSNQGSYYSFQTIHWVPVSPIRGENPLRRTPWRISRWSFSCAKLVCGLGRISRGFSWLSSCCQSGGCFFFFCLSDVGGILRWSHNILTLALQRRE